MHDISVVIPAYNSARWLPETVASALAQHRRPIEVIVVDDCSTDDTAAVARAAGATVLRTDRNGGSAAARNVGIAAARGSLLAFLDADDLWDPDHCDSVASLLDEFPDAVVAFGPTRSIGLYEAENTVPTPSSTPTDVLLPLFRGNFINQSSAIARRDAVAAVGGFREEFWHAEDFDLWLRLAEQGPFVRAPTITTSYRTHPSQATRDTAPIRRYAWDIRLAMYESLRQRLPPERMPAIEDAIRTALARSFVEAWRGLDDRLLTMALETAGRVPGGDTVSRAWRTRLAIWPAWKRAIRLYRRLPAPVRRVIQPWQPPWRPVD